MSNPIEQAAFVSVGRACGFAGLAVVCIVMGLAFEPSLAARTGGVLSLVVCVVLLVRARFAPSWPYKRTEAWLILRKGDRPRAELAQRLVGNALKDAYLFFAQKASVITMMFTCSAVVFQLQGF